LPQKVNITIRILTQRIKKAANHQEQEELRRKQDDLVPPRHVEPSMSRQEARCRVLDAAIVCGHGNERLCAAWQRAEVLQCWVARVEGGQW
jgi:hypothetical protein